LSPAGIYYSTSRFQFARWEHTIWYHDFETAQSRQLYRKEGPFEMGRLSISPGEEWLLFDCVPTPEVDIMLVENFR